MVFPFPLLNQITPHCLACAISFFISKLEIYFCHFWHSPVLLNHLQFRPYHSSLPHSCNYISFRIGKAMVIVVFLIFCLLMLTYTMSWIYSFPILFSSSRHSSPILVCPMFYTIKHYYCGRQLKFTNTLIKPQSGGTHLLHLLH